MKRLMLGLVLLGSTSMVFARNQVEKKSVKINKSLYATCYSQTVTQYEDSNGVYIRSEAGPKVERTCAEGEVAGFTRTTYVRKRISSIDPQPI